MPQIFSRRLQMPRPHLKRMEAEGILSRRKGEMDARQMIVSLTPKGKRLQKELKDVPATVGSSVLCKEVTPESVPGLFMALDGIIGQLSKAQQKEA